MTRIRQTVLEDFPMCSRIRVVLISLAWLITATAADAHAILKESVPAVRAIVQGPDVAIRLKFNSRIDAIHSRLYLNGSGGARQVDIAKQTSPDTLAGEVKQVAPGEYRIEWQVLAVDGHITRGELPFTVR
jgi:methionine-rich copper-binding protein CopC